MKVKKILHKIVKRFAGLKHYCKTHTAIFHPNFGIIRNLIYLKNKYNGHDINTRTATNATNRFNEIEPAAVNAIKESIG
jgi:hypothetical protein